MRPVRQFDVEKDYYAILEISSTASLRQIKKKFRELSKKQHPDQMKHLIDADFAQRHALGSQNHQTALQKAENDYAALVEAHTVLSDKTKRSDYDEARANQASGIEWKATPVPESERRGQEPANEKEFFEWLAADAEKYTKNLSFQYGSRQSGQVLQNIWKLIETTRLSYSHFETEAMNNILLWTVVFEDDALTEFVCRGLIPNDAEHGVVQPWDAVNLILMLERYEEDARRSASAFDRLEENWQSLSHSEEIFTDEERFLLFILSGETIEPDGYVRTGFIRGSMFPGWLSETGLTQQADKWMVDLLRAYRKKELLFDQLRQQLRYISAAIFKDRSYSFLLIGKRLILPLKAKIEELSKNKGEVSQIKIEQLKTVLNEVNQTIKQEIIGWVEANKKQPEDVSNIKLVLKPKAAILYQKVEAKLTEYENKEEIGKNANLIGAILKWLKCAAQTLFTVGMALVSQRVRDGLFFRPNTQVILRTCREAVAEEKEKIQSATLS